MSLHHVYGLGSKPTRNIRVPRDGHKRQSQLTDRYKQKVPGQAGQPLYKASNSPTSGYSVCGCQHVGQASSDTSHCCSGSSPRRLFQEDTHEIFFRPTPQAIPAPCVHARFICAGIPKINVPPIEPFVLPALEINRDLDAIKIRAFIQNAVAYGGSGFVINSLKTDIDKLALELSINLPRIDVTAEYDVDGRVLVAPIKSSGVFKGNFTDVHVEAKGDGKVITKEGVEYLQVNKIQTKIQVGDSGVKISDKDDKRGLLNESTVQFYNQNKKQILNIILPIVQETAEELITQIGNRILGTFPLSELLPA
ncbi:hypothetical protein Cfor_06094 [Coptotermes formosanus]|uniref:Circadian clock-controlled protein n=1 Tax=Coptotermes formosanus TaxID=36987 RepID=A0A6L2Q0X6_COPFO|nr:hypothetical protein Cfor_06094 [Coptotermes formosanus]